MHELITRLTETAGITTDQATKALETIKDFVKEKFPMMAGAVDNLFASASETATTNTPVIVEDSGAPKTSESILDKISDVIPGESGQKVEDFAKGAAQKAEEVFDSIKEKLSDIFDGTKK
jgi:hypothetical protein